jgi:hypothetical protein
VAMTASPVNTMLQGWHHQGLSCQTEVISAAWSLAPPPSGLGKGRRQVGAAGLESLLENGSGL